MNFRILALAPFAFILAAATGCAPTRSVEDGTGGSAAETATDDDKREAEATIKSLAEDTSDVTASIAPSAARSQEMYEWQYRIHDNGFSVAAVGYDGTETSRMVFAVKDNQVIAVGFSTGVPESERIALLQAAHDDYQAAANAVPDVPGVDVSTDVTPQSHLLYVPTNSCASAQWADHTIAGLLLFGGLAVATAGGSVVGGVVFVVLALAIDGQSMITRDGCVQRNGF